MSLKQTNLFEVSKEITESISLSLLPKLYGENRMHPQYVEAFEKSLAGAPRGKMTVKYRLIKFDPKAGPEIIGGKNGLIASIAEHYQLGNLPAAAFGAIEFSRRKSGIYMTDFKVTTADPVIFGEAKKNMFMQFEKGPTQPRTITLHSSMMPLNKRPLTAIGKVLEFQPEQVIIDTRTPSRKAGEGSVREESGKRKAYQRA